jgi:hypothetical protein
VAGEPLLACPAAFDCAMASLIAASGMEPSGFARCMYIHSSAPSGSGMATASAVAPCVVPLLSVPNAAVPASTIVTAATAAAIAA